MSSLEIGAPGWQSLAQRLAQGKMPAAEALRYASLLAEWLRKAHDAGRVHGFLTPSVVWLKGPAVEVTPPLAGPRALTPYTAPEALTGKQADCRGDIFAFGAIVYEMLTGRRAFTGENQPALVQSLRNSQPPSTGSAAADKLLAGCLAKDPAHRWRQIHKVDLELKLLAVAVRKAEARRPHAASGESDPSFFQAPPETPAPAPSSVPYLMGPAQPAPAPPPPAQPVLPPALEAAPSAFPPPAAPYFSPDPGLYPTPSPYFQSSPDYSSFRSEMQQSETRLLATRLQMGEKGLADLHRAVADAVAGLRSQLSTLSTQVATSQDRPNFSSLGGDSVSDAALARIEKTIQAFAGRLETVERGMAVMQDRVSRAEQESEAARQQVNTLHGAMADDFVAFESSLHKQEKAVDSARTAMAQTDDLVERLVEALEALQSSVLDRPEQQYSAASIN